MQQNFNVGLHFWAIYIIKYNIAKYEKTQMRMLFHVYLF